MKVIITISFFVLFLLTTNCISQEAKKAFTQVDKLREAKNDFSRIAQMFAYQEHFHWNRRELLCNQLIFLYKEVNKLNNKDINKVKLQNQIYGLGNLSSTCGSSFDPYQKKTVYPVSAWQGVDQLHKKFLINKKNHILLEHNNRDYCQEAVSQKLWDRLYYLTEETLSGYPYCKEAYNLVEPHWSYEYKMRNYE